MLTRAQLTLLTAMATLGGAFAGFLVVGITSGDVTLAMIVLAVIIAAFCIMCVVGIGSGEKPAKKRVGDIHVGGEVLPEFK